MELASSTVRRRKRRRKAGSDPGSDPGQNGVRPRSDPHVRIGCSGWQYAHWRGDFYPPELPSSRWFAHYALHFDTVEINNSFYDRLDTFLRALGPAWARATGTERGPRSAIEFRDPSWYDDRVFALLEHHGVALCLHDMHSSASGGRIVGPFIYVRFHFGESKYGGAYDDARLDEWGTWLAARAASGLDAFAYFDNDVGGHAPRDAVRLRNRVKQRRVA